MASLELSGTTAVINGDLMNSAATSNPGGFAASGVVLDHNSTLAVNNLTNLAATSDNSDTALVAVQLTQGSTLNVNGNVNNTSLPLVSFFGPEYPEASISLHGKSVLNVNNGTFNNTGSFLYLTNNRTANVAGLFTNDINSLVSLGQATDYTSPSGSILNSNGGFTNSGEIDLNNVSTLNNTGAFNNTGVIYLEGSTLTTLNSKTASGSFTNDGCFGSLGGLVSVDSGSTLTVAGTFSNINGASLNITNNSTASVTGLFTNDCISSVILNGTAFDGRGGDQKGASGQQHSSTLPTPGASLTTYNGFSNAGLVSLNMNSALTNTGFFRNTGLILIDNASVLTNTGTFRNSGTVYTGATGGAAT